MLCEYLNDNLIYWCDMLWQLKSQNSSWVSVNETLESLNIKNCATEISRSGT